MGVKWTRAKAEISLDQGVVSLIVGCRGVVQLRGLVLGPTKVKVRKSFLFTEGSPEIENKEHDFVATLIFCLIPPPF